MRRRTRCGSKAAGLKGKTEEGPQQIGVLGGLGPSPFSHPTSSVTETFQNPRKEFRERNFAFSDKRHSGALPLVGRRAQKKRGSGCHALYSVPQMKNIQPTTGLHVYFENKAAARKFLTAREWNVISSKTVNHITPQPAVFVRQ
jgi:hypothetical protein